MQENNIMATVFMACYNHEPYIRQALDSVVNQITDFPFEIIVHDDASTDASADIIREYAQRYPHLIRPICQKENQYSQGINIRRTYVQPIARGKYMAYCECDDYWLDPGKLQKQVDFLEAHPEYTATYHNSLIINQQGEPVENTLHIYRPYRSHRYTLRRLALGAAFPGQTASLVHRRSVFIWESPQQEAAFYQLRISTGDKRTTLQLLLAGDVYCFEEKMSAHRVVTQSGDSWSARNFGKNLSFQRHAAAIDSARYAKEYYGKAFPNTYTVFHTGLACVVKYLKRPTAENQEVYRQFLAEHGGLPRALFYLLGIGLISIPLAFARRAEITKYDPKEQL